MKKLATIALILCSAFGLSGCFSLVDWGHNSNQLRAWNNDLDSMHKTFDWYFLNYDQSDPSGDYSYESPNLR